MILAKRLELLRKEILETGISEERLHWLCNKHGIDFQSAKLPELGWLLEEAKNWREYETVHSGKFLQIK